MTDLVPFDPSESSFSEEDSELWGVLNQEARKSNLRFKMSAAMIYRGRIVAVATNTRKTHPRYGSKEKYNTLHCEGNLLWTCEKLGIDPRGMTMLIFRKNYLNAKPCRDCQKLIEKAGIKKVIYTSGEFQKT